MSTPVPSSPSRAEQLAALLERVEKAEGPDREIDAELWALAEGIIWYRIEGDAVIAQHPKHFGGHEYFHGLLEHTILRYTASIDAAVSLVEKVLPGWSWLLSSNGSAHMISPDFEAAEEEWLENKGSTYADYGKTPALALCAALLRAVLADEGTKATSPAQVRSE